MNESLKKKKWLNDEMIKLKNNLFNEWINEYMN